MEIPIGSGTLHLPSLPTTIVAIAVIYLLVRWSKELEERQFTVYFYFLISLFIAPIFSMTMKDGVFELWLPVGFLFILLYLNANQRYNWTKMKASLLGFAIAIYLLVLKYIEIFSSGII